MHFLVLSFTIVSLSLGALNVPLDVSNWQTIERSGEPVTAGIPLPIKGVYDLSTLRITDASGNTIPAQFKPLSKWWSEVNSGETSTPSLKWVLCDFQTSVASKNLTRVFLKDDNGNSAPQKPVTLTEDASSITVVTGPLKFTLSKTNFNLFNEAWLDANNNGTFETAEKVFTASNGSGSVIAAGDWAAGGCVPGTLHKSSQNAPTRIVIEENGSMKVTIRIEGKHYAASGGVTKGLYGWQCFITAFAGKPYVDVQWAVTNMLIDGNRPPEKTTGGTPFTVYSWPMASCVLSLDLNLNNSSTQPYVMLGTDEVTGTAGTTAARLLQKSNTFTLTGASSGTMAKGGVSLSDGNLGLRVVMRDFAVNNPKALSVFKNKIEIELFPDTGTGSLYWLDPQTRKNHRMRFEFFNGASNSGDLSALSQKAEAPLRMLAANREWYMNTRSWERGFGVPSEATFARLSPSLWTRMDKAAYRTYLGLPNWDSYGQIEEFNGGGDHMNLTSCFWRYILTGSPSTFESYEAKVFWFNDRVQNQYQPDAWQTFAFYLDPLVHGHLYRYCHGMYGDGASPVQTVFPGYSTQPSLAYSHNPDDGHMTQLQQIEYYQLTGDPATLDAMEGLALRAAGQIFSVNYLSGRNCDGCLPPLTDSLDLDSNFALMWGPRYVSRPAMVCLHAYEFTGNYKYLYPAKIAVYGMSNVIRRHPIGYLATAGEETYCSQGQTPWATDHPSVPIPKYFAGSDFQIGIGMEGMYSYLVRTGDEKVRDALIQAGASMMWRMNQDSLGRWSGFVYEGWCDYGYSGKRYKKVWGKSAWDNSVMPNGRGYYSSSAEGFGGFIFSYLASGRTDFLPVLQDGWDAWDRSFANYGELKAFNLLEAFYKRDSLDASPPSAVSDLSATREAAGVRITWTAPGGDGTTGKAAKYQIKIGLAPLCDLPSRWDSTTKKGWPDLNEPLPYTSNDLISKAVNFTRTQELSFWAAKDVNGEPVPQNVGSTETMLLMNLDSSIIHYIALVSYDEAGNVSSLSNVASARGTGVESQARISGDFALLGAAPNPFNPSVKIKYNVANDKKSFSLKIYDASGKIIKTLYNGSKAAGSHSVIWNGKDSYNRSVASGVYIYELKTDRFVKRMKMVMVE